MFQNLTSCKNSDSKNDELFKVDWKSDILWNSWFKVWRVVKNLFQNLFFFESLHSKTVFFSFFSLYHGFWEIALLKKLAFLRDSRVENRFSASKSFIKISFHTNQVHFKIWSVVKLFFRNLTRSKMSIPNCRVLKKCHKSDAFEKLTQNMTRCTKNDSKTDYIQNFWSIFSFLNGNIFLATIVPTTLNF